MSKCWIDNFILPRLSPWAPWDWGKNDIYKQTIECLKFQKQVESSRPRVLRLRWYGALLTITSNLIIITQSKEYLRFKTQVQIRAGSLLYDFQRKKPRNIKTSWLPVDLFVRVHRLPIKHSTCLDHHGGTVPWPSDPFVGYFTHCDHHFSRRNNQTLSLNASTV